MICNNCGEELDDEAVADAIGLVGAADLARAAAPELAEWFDWAVQLVDELGLSRGPVAAGEDPTAWTSALLRAAIARRLKFYAGELPLPREDGGNDG